VGTLREHNQSLWAAGVEDLGLPRIDGRREADVVIAGAGIAGLLTAWCAQRDGARVVVVDAGPVAGGATGYTSAKVAVLQGTVYSELRRRHGAAVARTYAAAHSAGLDLIAGLVDELGIDCDWERRPAYTITTQPDQVGTVEEEGAAAREAGLGARVTTDTDLPFPVGAAVRLDDQAQFDSLRFSQGLARAILERGGAIYENSRATGLREGLRASTLVCDGGSVTAGRVVVATHLPFLDRGLYFARTNAVRSYCVALETPDELPKGMYITAGSPTRSLRTARGDALLILGGESHVVGQDADTTRRYAALVQWAREHFSGVQVRHRWSAQDWTSVDGLPFVGPNRPGPGAPLVATAMRKWGLTGGAAAALILADLIAGRDNPWASTFSPVRLNPRQSASDLVRVNADTSVHLVGDRLKASPRRSVEDLQPGEGAVVRHGPRFVAASRDDDGELHVVSPRCTHLGCYVTWNTAERSWDCPCHASRFDRDGRVLEGPATKDLPRRA
jgi:glycine/D-amino acid oxidase-like deaminating enzyme/nitrite reductase/ring-hydroxylating ferredoxin subunit